MKYNNQTSEIKKESKAQFESSESNYQEIHKNNENSKTKNFANYFETAINTENIPELYLLLKITIYGIKEEKIYQKIF